MAPRIRLPRSSAAGDEGAGPLAAQLRKEQESGIFAGWIVRVSFESKQVGALQAADFAAYETTKQLVRTIGADERATRKSLEALVEKVPYVAEYFDSRSMSERASGARASVRSGVQSNFSPRTPKHQGKPGNTRDQRARRINKIENLTKSAKPPSPDQIRAAPPILK
jgi:hypothetical protein